MTSFFQKIVCDDLEMKLIFFSCTCRTARSKLPYAVVLMYRVQDIFEVKNTFFRSMLFGNGVKLLRH